MTVVAPNPASLLAQPVIRLAGVGPERSAQLARLEISTVQDLLLHRPRRYEDRRHFRRIVELQTGEAALTRGKIVALGVKWFAKHTKSIFEFILDDGSARLHCRWWNAPFLDNYYSRGDEVVVFGKVLQVKPRTIDHPETEIVQDGEEESIHLNRLTPVYPLTEGLPQRWLRSFIYRTVQQHAAAIPEPWPVSEKPLHLVLPARAEAIRMLHCPETDAEPQLAVRRLALDEFVSLQHDMQARRQRFRTRSKGLPCAGDNHLIRPFLGSLRFALTAAQTRVLRDMRQDMRGPHPMRRLLQGDVGSGKTLVAACCALMAIESGFTAALMAPTEILAEQHFNTFTRWFQPLGIPVELRTGSHKLSSPSAVASTGSAPPRGLFIGTHALLSEGVELPDLGLVIIDEQHRFGVAQREKLVRKGAYPHLLVMTATPIPRTLGLTVYGDLDISVLDESPPGRGKVQTFVRTRESLPKVWEFVRKQLSSGHQAYLVYPRVEDSGGAQVKAVLQEFQRLQPLLAPWKLGLLHGRLKAEQKESVMNSFRAGHLQVLVATSLIEVGVDVPNASLMLIEDAEQFGLAQLHQLRGRIRRGTADSYCILVSKAKTPEARQRLKVLESSNDGFKIAEADLRLRGPGELLGQEQSGVPRFRFGDLVNDWDLLQVARKIALTMLNLENR